MTAGAAACSSRVRRVARFLTSSTTSAPFPLLLGVVALLALVGVASLRSFSFSSPHPIFLADVGSTVC